MTEYPLISKAKDGGGTSFKNALHGFFVALVDTLAQTGLLYESNELMENIQVWISTMSSASNRPFRHTSTVAALGVTTALARIASDIVDSTAKKIRQSESEAKKKRVNKARVSAVNNEVAESNQKLEIVDAAISDWFSTVYVHRYRDVDPRIRVECVEALAEWIMTHPDKFFDGSHLRYLGWVLSDTNAPTRVEVLKQLARLFSDKDKLAGLKTFTERFRPRIVEIATRDAEIHVRSTAVELLDILREAGFLEPDDIDSVGKLIFDADTRVRKAVVGFFAENVNAAYDLYIEEMGGQEILEEALPPSDDDEYENPRLEWLKLKCLAEQLLAYDEDDTDLPSQIERIPPSGAELGLVAAGIESRFSLAAQSLYDAIPEMESWEVLAGYLLYDHSQTAQNGSGDDVEAMLRQNCRLEEKHETTLLDILNAVVKIRLQRLAETQRDKKKTKAQREADKEEQAEMGKRLSVLIPQLLKKFGALPEAAALCLRLERELNLDIFQELRQNAALTALLDDINKQFLTHHNERVLNEAIGSILHAQGNDELRDMIGVKIQALWEDLINTFDALRRGRDFSTRGDLDPNILLGVSNVVLKMAQLAKASDTAVLDHVAAPTKSKGKSKKGAAITTPPITSLLQILERGVPTTDLDPNTDSAEDLLVRHTMALMLVYFMWKCRDCATHVEDGTTIPEDDLTALCERRDACIATLMSIMESRNGADEVRVEAANLLLDVFNMFRSLKARKPKTAKTPKKTQGCSQPELEDDWESLCREIDHPTAKILLQILTAAESNLAKRAHKRLEEPDVHDDPIDPDDEPEDSDDEAEVEGDRQLRTLLAEERLCMFGGRMVQAVQAGTLDYDGEGTVRKRLERNKTKLTPTWKEVVNHLDVAKSLKKGGRRTAKPTKEPARPGKSKEIVVEDDSDEEEEQDHDPIEDEEMVDGDAEEHVNGEAAAENGVAEPSPEPESVLGD